MDELLQRWRVDTPAVNAGRVHLNNAGAALMPSKVADAIVDHLRRETAIGGYEAAAEAAPLIEDAYDDTARLVGAEPRNVALLGNATEAVARALSAFDFDAGDVIITTRHDYASNQLMYLSLAGRRGVRVVRAADLPGGGVDPGAVRQLVKEHRPRVVAVTWVPTNSGLVQDVAAIGEICAEADVPYLVDACQAVGQIPVDVHELRCDYLAATARKFLRGPRGIGFLYISDAALDAGAHPLLVDLRGAEWTDAGAFELRPDSRRFEYWEYPYALVLGLGEAVRYALDVGLDVARDRARFLAGLARQGLEAAGLRVLDRGAELCAIVTVATTDQDPHSIVEQLRDWGINTGAVDRSAAVIDMDDKDAAGAIRISPHYYNTERDVEAGVEALVEVMGA